jgi:hypothetical protein
MPLVDTLFVKDANGALCEIRTNPAVQAVAGTVAINNWPVLQPVSIADIPVHGVSQQGLWSVSISNTVAVSGPLTDTQLRAAPLEVTGAFFPATQPVSLASPVAVTGAFFQATQPISATALPLPAGASTETTLAAIKAKTDNLDVLLSSRTKPADVQHVTVDNASVAVTGTFWPNTQPVSIASMPSTPVTGTFFQATQPVSAVSLPLPSGAATETTLAAIKAKTDNLDVLLSSRTKPGDTQAVSIAAMPSTPVTGTFWPATQPVSLATNTPDVTDRATRLLGHVTVDNTSLPVTGAFFQATQPVSISSMPTTPVTGPLTDTQLRASAVPVSGPLTDTQLRASAVPVSGPLTDAQLRASAIPVSGFPAWPYPATVTRVAAQSGVVANASASATLAAAVGKTTYITSLQIFATGATAATAVNVTIVGLLGGTMTIPFDVPAGANLRATPILLDFTTPLPASAANTAIVVTLPALGTGNTRATANAQGFQL